MVAPTALNPHSGFRIITTLILLFNTMHIHTANGDLSAAAESTLKEMYLENRALIEPISDRLSAESLSNPSNPQTFLDALYNESAAKCDTLNLSSAECLSDCIYYNSIPNILSLQNSNDPDDQKQFEYFLTLYAMGANPVGYRDVGSPDMCTFYGGNYCNLPTVEIQSGEGEETDAAILNHACCLPGSCTGEDAHNLLVNNQFCYQNYMEAWPVLLKKVGGHPAKDFVIEEICEPMERELDKAGIVVKYELKFPVSAL